MKNQKIKWFFVYALLLLTGCIPLITPKRSIITQYYVYDSKYADSILTNYKSLVDEKYKKKDLAYPIYLLNLGLFNFYAKNYDDASKAFWAVYQIEKGQSELIKVTEWIKGTEKRVYKLSKRENALLHFYLGLIYFYQNSIDKALVELKKISLIEENEPQLPLPVFFSGKIYECLGKLDEAIIDYKKLQELTQKDSLYVPYLELAKIYLLLNNQKSAKTNIDKLKTMGYEVPPNLNTKSLKKDFEELIIIIEQNNEDAIDSIKIHLDKNYLGKPVVIDVFQPGISAGEAIRKTMKEATGMVARETAKKGIEEVTEKIFGDWLGSFMGGLIGEKLLGSEMEEKRKWDEAPDMFLIHASFIPKGQIENILIEFFTQNGPYQTIRRIYSFKLEELHKINNMFFLHLRYLNKVYKLHKEEKKKNFNMNFA